MTTHFGTLDAVMKRDLHPTELSIVPNVSVRLANVTQDARRLTSMRAPRMERMTTTTGVRLHL